MRDDEVVSPETIEEIAREMRKRANAPIPTAKILGGPELDGRVALRTLDELEEEQGELREVQRRLRDSLKRELAHLYAGRRGMIPILRDGEEKFV